MSGTCAVAHALLSCRFTVLRRRTSKITNPMTPIGPVPFVGRQSELAELRQHLAVVPLVSLHGPLGSGKTRLLGELAPSLGGPCTLIECHPGGTVIVLENGVVPD